MSKFKGKFGVMQGRLSPSKDNLIQHYPAETWEQEFQYCAELNLKCIEWIFEFPNYNMNALFHDKGINRIKGLSKKYDVEVNSVVADYFMVNKIFKEKQSDIDKNIQVFKNLISQCKLAQIPIIEVPFVDSSSIKNDKDKQEVVKNLSPLIDIASDSNIKISLETDLDPKHFKKFINSFENKNIFINYDMGNSASLGYDPIEEINEYGEYIINVHIKDRVIGGTTVPLGTGDTEFKRVFGALKSINYSNDFIFQSARQDIHTDSPKDYIEVMKEYIKFIENYLS